MVTTVLEQFEAILGKRYISHIHTTFSDGKNTVCEYVEWAARHDIGAMLFSDHVRKQPSYDLSDYVAVIAESRATYPDIELLAGLEAKLLPGGGLDIPDNIEGIQVLFFACHSFPDDPALYVDSFMTLFRDRRWKGHVRIWAHPGYFFLKNSHHGIESSILNELIGCAREEHVLIERSLKYDIISSHVFTGLAPSEWIEGYDAHSVDELDSRTCNPNTP